MIGQHSGSGCTDQSQSGSQATSPSAYPREGRGRSRAGAITHTPFVDDMSATVRLSRAIHRARDSSRVRRQRSASCAVARRRARARSMPTPRGTIDRGREGSIVAISREVLRARERAMGVWARAMTDGDFCVCVSRARADEHLGQGGYSARIRGDLSMRSVVGFRIRSRARARFGSRLPASSCAPRRAWGVRTMRNSV